VFLNRVGELVTRSFGDQIGDPRARTGELELHRQGPPDAEIELPSGRMGLRKKLPSEGAWYCTQTVKLVWEVLSLSSAAVQVTRISRRGTSSRRRGAGDDGGFVDGVGGGGRRIRDVAPLVLVAKATRSDGGWGQVGAVAVARGAASTKGDSESTTPQIT